MANSASVHCVESDGLSEIVQTEAGAIGYCRFTDGSVYQEWAFYRGTCHPGDSLKEAATVE